MYIRIDRNCEVLGNVEQPGTCNRDTTIVDHVERTMHKMYDVAKEMDICRTLTRIMEERKVRAVDIVINFLAIFTTWPYRNFHLVQFAVYRSPSVLSILRSKRFLISPSFLHSVTRIRIFRLSLVTAYKRFSKSKLLLRLCKRDRAPGFKNVRYRRPGTRQLTRAVIPFLISRRTN